MLELSSARPPGSQLPYTPIAESKTRKPITEPKSGKLNTPDAVDRASGGEMEKVQNVIQVSPVVGGYRIAGNVCGTSVTLLLDTGAAETHLRHDVWMSIADRMPHLQPWHGATLVSAGGNP